MDGVYEELDEAKAEIERLRGQYRVKAELAERLKRAHSEELNKNKEASSRLEKLTHELQEKSDEITDARKIYEDLKSCFTEKEGIIRDLTSRYDRLRFDCNEKLRELEDENRSLRLNLDEANDKNVDQDKTVSALKQELEGIRRDVSFSKKCLETESKSKISKESEEREDGFTKLEDENRKFEDQLKWKREQFSHLQEAHEKLTNEFQREKEWEKDRSELLGVICSLETNLESQTRILRDLEYRLQMCNQALAHSESKRKTLEGQLLESKTCFDNISAEYDDAKSSFENMSAKRNHDIATLRSCLSTKEILHKEMEYQFRKMEQENQELLASLKELQEAQIHEAGFSSASKLQKKRKSLESVHKCCEVNLKAKESEWISQMNILSDELNFCRSELKDRDVSLGELKKELQACDSLMLNLELMHQEFSFTQLVLKSEFSEAQLRFTDDCSRLNLQNNLLQHNILQLVEQIENKKAAINSVQKDLDYEREKVSLLSRKVQVLEELQSPLQKEVDRLKEMLENSRSSELQSQEHVLLIESDLKKACDALDRANEELYDKIFEASEIEFELMVWKSLAEKLEETLKQNRQVRGEIEASLLSQTEVELNLKQEKESLSQQLEKLQLQLDVVNEQEREVTLHHQLVEEKDQRISDLQQLVASLEQEFETSSNSFSSRLEQMQMEIHILRESWEKIKEAEICKEREIQEKNIMIKELEKDVSSVRNRMEQQEMEIHKLENKLAVADDTIKRLSENSTHLSSEKENVMNHIGSLYQKMQQITRADQQLMENWGKVVQALSESEQINDNEEGDPTKKNMNILPSQFMQKKVEALHEDQRSPFRIINT